MIRYSSVFFAFILLVSSALAADKAPKNKAPPEATVFVNCNAGELIADALATPALNLTIEIDGICAEDFEITRTNLTLRGDDPLLDGIRPDPDGLQRQAVTLRNVSIINIENLTLTGAFTGIGINDSFGVNVTNCRLENNTFAGAIIGTASGSINFTNTVISAPTPPDGSFLLRGLWVTNGSNARCFNCAISDYLDSLYVSTGSQLLVQGGTVSAGRRALTVLDNSSADVNNPSGSISGYLRLENKGYARLRNATLLNSGTPHSIRDAASLVLEGSTQLQGDAMVGEFSNLTMLQTSQLVGNLSCLNGGDAYCTNASVQTLGANCGLCNIPPD